MKELTIEEKAARYDEAIERANSLLSSNELGNAWIYKLLPELKESEDYKIRKDIISFLKEGKPYYCPNSVRRQKWAAWLEKQGEQKPVDFKAKDWYVSKVDGKIHNMTYNPTDKVEPKFKVGDWITDGVSKCQIRFIDDTQYWYSENCILGSVESVDKRYHLWTIQDAKDGDVLAYPDGSITLFKYLAENIYMAHVLWVDGHIELNNSCAVFNVQPATKEQRDLLLQKMKEAGYEWDAEKKELTKIEQNPIWSKEDEKKRKCLIKGLEDRMGFGWASDPFSREEYIDWLKSIKDRAQPQPKQEWSEEDVNRFRNLIYLVERSDEGTGTKKGFIEFINRLKLFKGKEQPKWKPSDAQMEALESAAENCAYSEYQDCLREMIGYLKKLRGE